VRSRAPRTIRLLAIASLATTSLVAVPTLASAALNIQPDATSAGPWGANGRVVSIVRTGNVVFLGGDFTAMQKGNQATEVRARSYLAAVNATTGEPLTWAPALNDKVMKLTLSPDRSRLYVGGSFTTIDGQNRRRVAAFDLTNPASPALLEWKPQSSPNGAVRAIAQLGSTVYLGGGFTSIGTTSRPYLAAVRATDGVLLGWAPIADNIVRDLAICESCSPVRVYAGGNFATVNGSSQKTMAVLDAATGQTIGCGACHPGYPAIDMEAANGRLYVAGGGAGGRAAAFNLSTGAQLWQRKLDGNAQGVGVIGTSPVFGGHFFTVDKGTAGQRAVSQIIRLNPTTGALDTGWLPFSNGLLGVFAVHGFGDRVYLGGDFNQIGGPFNPDGTQISADGRPRFASFTDPDLQSADLGVSVSDLPDPVDLGQPLTYTATVSNAGPNPASGVTLVDPLPSGVTFSSAGPGCSYDTGTRTVACAIGALGAGASVQRQIVVVPGTAGALSNTLAVSGDQPDPSSSNDSATATTMVNGANAADLNVTLATSPAEPIPMGTQFDLQVKVKNEGTLQAQNVSISVPLPSQVSFVSVPATVSPFSCVGGATVSCTAPQLGQAVTKTIPVTVVAPAQPMTVSFSATASTTSFDPDATDNAASLLTSISDPAFASDTTKPALSSVKMFDDDADGRVDRLLADFDEPLSTCVAPCATGWSLTDVPSLGSFASATVGTGGNADKVTIALNEGAGDPDTAVGAFRVALASTNLIQDRAGNHASFGPATPLDGAGPVPVAFRKGRSTNTNCPANAGDKIAGPCDQLASEWSEALLASSIPATTTVTITDPSGSGNDRLTVPGFIGGQMDLGSDGYVLTNGASASFQATLAWKTGTPPSLVMTIPWDATCTGTGCASLAAVGGVIVTYAAPSGPTDPAGNPVAGQFLKDQSSGMF
jgi:uncharacterized repeat protein (TIGR01451 family)